MPGCLIEKGNENKIEQNLNIDMLKAPIFQGQKVGEITYTLDGNIIIKVNLVAQNNVDKISFFSVSKELIYKWFYLLR